MSDKDPEITRIDALIDEARREAANAGALVDELKQRRDAIKFSISSLKANISELKRQADNEYEAVRVCKAAHNRIDADNHRYRAESFRSARSEQYELLDAKYEELNAVRSDLDAAYERLKSATSRKNELFEQRKARVERLRAERAAKAELWKEKPCAKCGTNVIRYRTDWAHIPNICPDCKKRLEEERSKWAEKPCAGCGKNVIRYRTDWTHIPNYCKECKARFAAEKASKAGGKA